MKTILLFLLCPCLLQAAPFLFPSNALPVVQLAWNSSTNDTYNIYWGTGSRQYTNLLSTTNAVGTITLAGRGPTYFFAVTAVDPLTHLESDFSNEVSWTPALPPNPPTGLRPPVILTVQVRQLSDLLWADAGMNWSFDPSRTNAVFRLSIAQAQSP